MLRRLLCSLTAFASPTLSSTMAASSSVRPRNSLVPPTFHPADSSRFLVRLSIVTISSRSSRRIPMPALTSLDYDPRFPRKRRSPDLGAQPDQGFVGSLGHAIQRMSHLT